ncbi:uncharacterized protein ALTATR162_LOCUS50 [Alternaria atra]|uniref:HMG box domain-containing protein n=1 Tax=Alternaria atra TaxID=119953 RepID=A0A8J2HQS8_9PLEO|nr:uncharacterized protein ALTATR162_LOCUS50 [Alternaria atra]CAG5137194.1 unnamed protein product [Alternaria atra]
MTDLAEELERLGLSEYLDVLVAEGFDTWETVSDITESDLNSLNVKIGHQRSDEHAPGRPLSAYVVFANHVRETLKGQELSFTEIAKFVGERWQVLPAEAREVYQCQAKAGKEKYHAELAEYKGSPKYDAYQKYLKEFKAKHAAPYNSSYGKDTFQVRNPHKDFDAKQYPRIRRPTGKERGQLSGTEFFHGGARSGETKSNRESSTAFWIFLLVKINISNNSFS